MSADPKAIQEFVFHSWEESVQQTLETYISIPNQSPDYDPEIYTNGYQEQALSLLTDWVKALSLSSLPSSLLQILFFRRNVKGLKMEVLEEKEKTPFIFIEVEGTAENCEELRTFFS